MKHKTEITIGLLAILAVCILIFGIDYLKGINVFKPANYYHVSYTDVKGLNKSAPVTLNGYKVGVVREISYQYNNPGHILVELSLDKNLKIPVGSHAVIEQDLLGTASVALQLSNSTDYHTVGQTLIGETHEGMLDNISGTLVPQLKPMLASIDSLLTNLNTITGNPALNTTITRLDKISADLSATIAQINKASAALPPMVDNFNHASQNINTMSADLAHISTELKQLPIDSTFNNINTISSNLATLSAQLNNPTSTLGLLTHDPQLYLNLNRTVASLDSLFIDIKANPKRYINIKLL